MNKSKTMAVIICVLLLLSFNPFFSFVEQVKAADTDYYVSNTGSDSDTGLIGHPWKTIGHVNGELADNLSAGDNVYFNRGDTFTDAQLTVGLSGASTSDHLIIGAYGEGEKPIIDSPTLYNIYIDGQENVTIENLTSNNSGYLIYSIGGVANITIQNCNLTNSGGQLASVHFHENGGSYIRILNNYFNNGGDDSIYFKTNYAYVLIEGNTFIGGANNEHGCINVKDVSDHIIVRNNDISVGSNGDDAAEILRDSEYFLVENNILHDNSNNVYGTGFKTNGGYRGIIRKNICYNNAGTGLEAYSVGAADRDVSYTKWYHNTIYNTGFDGGNSMNSGFCFYAYNGTQDNIHNNTIKNNIIHTTHQYAFHVSANVDWDSHVANNNFSYNFFYNSATNDVRYMRVNHDMTYMETNYPTLFYHNTEKDAEFADAANDDFNLNASSPCIDNATFLTTCNGGGNDGTAVTVHDAGYFCDGFGLIDGDKITVGTDDVTITGVNYGTNVLTVTPSFTWVDDDNVSLRYNGTAPDIGALESAGDEEPSDPDSLSEDDAWNIINSTDVTILNLTVNGDLHITGSLYESSSEPSDVVFSMNSSLWLVSNGSLYIAGTEVESVATPIWQIDNTTDIAILKFSSDGNLYVAGTIYGNT